MGSPLAARRTEQLRFDGLRIEPASHRLWLGEAEPDLTPLEFSLLLVLARAAGSVVPAPDLLTKFWGAPDADSKSLSVRIRRLRRKLGDDPRNPRWIATVAGVGYRFEGRRVRSGDS